MRPDGYVNPYTKTGETLGMWAVHEAGADAMLEGLADLVGEDGSISFERKDGKVVAVYIDD